MSSFAKALGARIRGEEQFQQDVRRVCAAAIGNLLPTVETVREEYIESSIERILACAFVFAQTDDVKDWSFAQDLALYSFFSTKDSQQREISRRILSSLGNHPGVDRISVSHEVADSPLFEYIHNSLLRALNTIHIEGKASILTDFQHDVWTSLRGGESIAISAPTSAGKSYVVLEHLCRQVIDSETFSAVYIVPTRALLGEISTKISARLSEYEETIRVSTVPTLDPSNKKKQLYVLTQERLQVLLLVWSGRFDLVVIDEAQSISDASRGIILQDTLEQISGRGSDTKFVFLTPGAQGFDAIEQATGVQTLNLKETKLSPVLQNRIVVSSSPLDDHRIKLSLLTEESIVEIGEHKSSRGFSNPDTMLAVAALELGGEGGSLVYGTGPSDAETVAGVIASDIDIPPTKTQRDLSDFIKKHIHAKYSLSDTVLKGVGAHYGKMPGLLREALETHFKEGHLRYLVCTTTLFQGVNLPARNVFIDTPKRGRGENLDAASLWNFAGRAGRLGKDVVGNVFLVGYDRWDIQPLTKKESFVLRPSFRHALTEKMDAVMECLKPQPERAALIKPTNTEKAAAGLLIARYGDGTFTKFLERTVGNSIDHQATLNLTQKVHDAFTAIALPANILKANWTIDGFALSKLYVRLRKAVKEGEAKKITPIHPSDRSTDPYPIYFEIFRRINHYLLNSNNGGFHMKVAITALSWMRGTPLPVLISKAIDIAYKKKVEKNSRLNINYDSEIRKVFEFVEDKLRFEYVQYGRAYIDVLRYALQEEGYTSEANSIYDFPLALELGVSSAAGQVFIELGLSRITSAALESLIPDSSPTPEKAKKWLAALKGTEFELSAVIWSEIRAKGLMPLLSENEIKI